MVAWPFFRDQNYPVSIDFSQEKFVFEESLNNIHNIATNTKSRSYFLPAVQPIKQDHYFLF